MFQKWLDLSDEVRMAKVNRQPLVALESTIISHGMPYPQNLETAMSLEAEVRAHGAVPATIALREGRIKIGLNPDELQELATASHVAKVSRRDLPVVLAQGGLGATTVAATMICARLAEIPIFATGGIGGVHRGAETTMDISADLMELARTSVAVVCTGAKSILDLGLTLEYLETHGVPVIGYGTDRFPAFYTRDSGLGLESRVDNVDVLARILHAKWGLGLSGGVVIANPVPEAHALDGIGIEKQIETAVAEATAQGITGKAVTPFLLRRMGELTAGRSLTTNIALVRNNARLAAQLAVAYHSRVMRVPHSD